MIWKQWELIDPIAHFDMPRCTFGSGTRTLFWRFILISLAQKKMCREWWPLFMVCNLRNLKSDSPTKTPGTIVKCISFQHLQHLIGIYVKLRGCRGCDILIVTNKLGSGSFRNPKPVTVKPKIDRPWLPGVFPTHQLYTSANHSQQIRPWDIILFLEGFCQLAGRLKNVEFLETWEVWEAWVK